MLFLTRQIFVLSLNYVFMHPIELFVDSAEQEQEQEVDCRPQVNC